jgi:hypothetical protein
MAESKLNFVYLRKALLSNPSQVWHSGHRIMLNLEHVVSVEEHTAIGAGGKEVSILDIHLRDGRFHHCFGPMETLSKILQNLSL